MHPLLKPYNLFYRNGVAILEFYQLEIFQDASSPETLQFVL